MKKIIVIIVCVFLFINCSNSTSNEKKSSADSTLSSAINTSANYNNWQSAKGEKIEFKYPQDWRLKIRKTKGTTQFGLTNDADTSDIFFPIEIWEFDPAGHKFEEFSGVPHQYFEKATDGKRANLVNQSATTFKGFEARKYEFNKDNYPVDIITVNSIKKYFMLVSYREDSVNHFAYDIFNSINILDQ